MPQYLFSNPDNPDEIEIVILSVNDEKIFIKNGVKWNREFSVPFTAVNTVVDPFSEKSYLAATENKKETIGSLQDRSRELSEKRESKDGIDTNKQKYFDNYSKIRKGKEHPEVKKKKVQDSLKKMGVTLES